MIAGNGQPWASGSLIQAYREQVSYDPNGNILTYLRNGAPGHERMDDLTYGYNRSGNGDLINNRLRHVKDAAGATGQGDLGDQGEDNYSYDKIGNLKTDNAEGIDKIEWNVYGKINAIRKANGTTIGYGYDATGNRVSKTVTTSGTPSSTYYVRDAQGNTLGVYSQKNSNFSWEEQHLYGSSRLGMLTPKLTVSSNMNTDAYTSVGDHTQDDGNRLFELTNHLGNVLATISDKLIPKPGDANNPAYTDADVVTAQEYYPFGMGMPGRSYSIGKNYRYGFGGQEKSEVTLGNYTAEYWEYDSRIGRRWNTDPVVKNDESPYMTFGNNPIVMVDPSGADWYKKDDKLIFNEAKHGSRKGYEWKGKEFDEGGMHYGKDGKASKLLDEVVVTASKKGKKEPEKRESEGAGAALSSFMTAFNHTPAQAVQWDMDRANYDKGSYSSLTPSQIAMFERRDKAEADWRALNYAILDGATFFVPVPKIGMVRWLKPFGNTVGRVFWSGGGTAGKAFAAATEHAALYGGTTLEMTTAGKALTWVTKKTGENMMTGKLWSFASRQFAKGASGEIHMFMDLSKVNPGGFWFKQELPTLTEKGLDIITHIK